MSISISQGAYGFYPNYPQNAFCFPGGNPQSYCPPQQYSDPQSYCPPQPYCQTNYNPFGGGFGDYSSFGGLFSCLFSSLIGLFNRLNQQQLPDNNPPSTDPPPSNDPPPTEDPECDPDQMAIVANKIKSGVPFKVKFDLTDDTPTYNSHDPLGQLLGGSTYSVRFNPDNSHWTTTGFNELIQRRDTDEAWSQSNPDNGRFYAARYLDFCANADGEIIVKDHDVAVGHMIFS